MLTRQEMFSRAYLGLKSQGFTQCARPNDAGLMQCVYEKDGKRCAWGWVDLSLTENDIGTVVGLRGNGRGLAAELSGDDAEFAMELQKVHDSFDRDGLPMALRLRDFATKYGLTVPE
jgi:hypothetical protein